MRVEKNLENAKLCQCLRCPSYTLACKLKNKPTQHFETLISKDNTPWEILFCASEKSNCIHENRGCLCATCAVHKKYALNNEDYCLHTGGVF